MQNGYWTSISERRIARRRLLLAAGAGTAGAVLLAACGEKDHDDSKSAPGLVTAPADTTKQAKRGGILRHYARDEASGFDPAIGRAASGDAIRVYAYSPLVRYAPALLKPATNEIIPDLTSSWEFSADRLTLSLKLRQDVKWHNKPPVNARKLDVEDILYSFDRASRLGASRNQIFNSVSATAPVLSVTAPDSSTVVIKMNQPVFYILPLLASISGGQVNIVPKETDTTFDIRRDIIGTGPYILTKYEPSNRYSFSRNPEFYDPSGGYVDEVDLPILPDYAAALAQFRSGNIYSYEFVLGEDVLPLKRDVPKLNLYEFGEQPGSTLTTAFGWLPQDRSPFLDERVRQAYSRSFDRDLWLDTVYNVAAFRQQGLPVATEWYTSCSSDEPGWVDPRGKDFGPNGKFFQHDVAEAKRLLAAANYPNGLDVVSTQPSGTRFGPDYPRQVEVTEGMAREAGFRTTTRIVDYTTEFLPKFRESNGRHEGWSHRTSAVGGGEALLRFRAGYYSKLGGTDFFGFSMNGKSDASGDPTIDTLVEKGLMEFDVKRRNDIAGDLQRHAAGKMYDVKWPGTATGFRLAWPVIKNFLIYKTISGKPARPEFFNWWLDETLAPLNKT